MRRSHKKEMMDFPDNPKEVLAGDLRNLRTLNRYLGGYRSVMRGLDRLVGAGKLNRFSLLDVGTGSGDIPARITNWAQQRGIKASIVALEPEPVTARIAGIFTKRQLNLNPPFFPLLQRGETFSRDGGKGGEEGDFRRREITVVRGDGWRRRFAPVRLISFLHRSCCIIFPRRKSLRSSGLGPAWRGERLLSAIWFATPSLTTGSTSLRNCSLATS